MVKIQKLDSTLNFVSVLFDVESGHSWCSANALVFDDPLTALISSDTFVIGS